MQGHGPRSVVFDFAGGGQIGGVAAVALAGQGQIDHRLGQRDEAFGHAHEFHGLLAGDGQGQGIGIGQAHILRSGKDEAAADEARVLAAFQQAGQIVEGRVGIAAADGFDEGRGQLVMAVTVLVMAHHDFGQGGLELLRLAHLFGQGSGVLHQIEQGTGIPVGRGGDDVQHLVGKRHARLFGAAPGQLHQFRASQGA